MIFNSPDLLLEGLSHFAFRRLPAIALAQARRAGLNEKQNKVK
jgi:hypothetical protein